MPRGVPADRTHKAEIVTKIRDGGQSVSSVSVEHDKTAKPCPSATSKPS